MKKLTKCEKCHGNYDSYLDHCPFCGESNNDTSPLDKKFSNMIFLTDYKEFLLFIMGFVGLLIFSFITYIAFNAFPFDANLKSTLENFIPYVLTLGIMCCIISYDYKQLKANLIKSVKEYRYILVAIAATAIMIGFSFAYSAILKACGVSIKNNDNQQALETIVRSYPGFAFFFIVLFGPICEELAYRLGLFSVLRKRNRYLAYALTIVIFTLIHFNFTSNDLANECLNLPNYIIPAFLFCLVYERFGLTSTTFAHILNNLISFILVIAVIK